MINQTKSERHPIHKVYDGIIDSANGHKINLHKPDPDSIFIEDIAIGLSHICRFGGQLPYFYSVAQHSLIVATLSPPELKLAALLHDASEAYLGDIVKPLKVILGKAYTDIEDRFMKVIADKYGVTKEQLDAIKEWDIVALELEFHSFFGTGPLPDHLNSAIKLLPTHLWSTLLDSQDAQHLFSHACHIHGA